MASAAAAAPEEKDARLSYLSWRVWGMKRKRAEVALREGLRGGPQGEVEGWWWGAGSVQEVVGGLEGQRVGPGGWRWR